MGTLCKQNLISPLLLSILLLIEPRITFPLVPAQILACHRVVHFGILDLPKMQLPNLDERVKLGDYSSNICIIGWVWKETNVS